MTGVGADLADAALLQGVRRASGPALDRVLPALSRSADRGLLWIATAGLLALRRRDRRAGLRGLVGLGTTSALANGPAKLLIRRPRPGLGGLPLPSPSRHRRTTSSFPSGHSASAAAFVTGVALERPAYGAPLAVLGAAVILSRVHTGAHYPADVLAGATLGACTSPALAQAWPPNRSDGGDTRPQRRLRPGLPMGSGG